MITNYHDSASHDNCCPDMGDVLALVLAVLLYGLVFLFLYGRHGLVLLLLY